jgi:hypothetical protein
MRWCASRISPPATPSRRPKVEALGCTRERYTLASLSYDLSKIRAKGLVAKLANSRRYQLAAGILGLPRLPEALRTRLRATHRRPSLAPSKQTQGFKPKGDRNLIASISALSMISNPRSRNRSQSHDKDAKTRTKSPLHVL